MPQIWHLVKFWYSFTFLNPFYIRYVKINIESPLLLQEVFKYVPDGDKFASTRVAEMIRGKELTHRTYIYFGNKFYYTVDYYYNWLLFSKLWLSVCYYFNICIVYKTCTPPDILHSTLAQQDRNTKKSILFLWYWQYRIAVALLPLLSCHYTSWEWIRTVSDAHADYSWRTCFYTKFVSPMELNSLNFFWQGWYKKSTISSHFREVSKVLGASIGLFIVLFKISSY